jgi:hypothetical protein
VFGSFQMLRFNCLVSKFDSLDCFEVNLRNPMIWMG